MGQSKPKRVTRTGTKLETITGVQAKQQSDVRGSETKGLPGFDNIDEFEGISDAATVITDKLNNFLESTGDYDFFSEDVVKSLLLDFTNAQQIMNHVETEFGQGLLVGYLLSEGDREIRESLEEVADEETEEEEF